MEVLQQADHNTSTAYVASIVPNEAVTDDGSQHAGSWQRVQTLECMAPASGECAIDGNRVRAVVSILSGSLLGECVCPHDRQIALVHIAMLGGLVDGTLFV